MNIQEQILKDNIMRRVRFVYGMKRLPAVFVPKLAVLASLVSVAGFFVSFPNVIRNMPSLLEVSRFTDFTVSAFMHTQLIAQAVFLSVLIVIAYMVRDISRVFHTGSLRTA